MVNLIKNENDSILKVDGTDFKISNELASFLEATNSLNDDTITKTISKAGVITLKIKSLTYTICNDNKKKILNMYKINNNEGVIHMKTFIKFMKPKQESGKKNPFNSLILRVLKPALNNVEFEDIDAVRSTVYDTLKPLMSENSKWEIEDNTKTLGLVVKNEYLKEGKEYPSHNIFFINVVPEESTASE